VGGAKGTGVLEFLCGRERKNVFNPVLSLKGEENPQWKWTRNMWKDR
jgi:hypothetical protein